MARKSAQKLLCFKLAHLQRHDQVTGFQMAGELLGLDGINSEHTTATRWHWKTRSCA